MQDKIDQFKNLYWTRIINPDNFENEDEKKWLMSYDIVLEIQKMSDIDENDQPEWVPLWDPNAFADEHPKPKTVDFEYSEETLKQLAIKTSSIRTELKRKTNLLSKTNIQIKLNSKNN